MKIKILILLFISNISFYSQEFGYKNLYLDEYKNEINSIEYRKKCNSFLYNCQKQIHNEDLAINYMIEEYKFGKLSKTAVLQIQQLLSRDTKSDLKNKTIIISYRNFITGYDESKNISDTLSIDMHFTDFSSKGKYTNGRKIHDNNQKRCIKKFENLKATPIYLYNHNFGYEYKPKNFNWFKVSKTINNLFFDDKSPSMLILKSDGNYFRYSQISEYKLEQLVKKDWTQFIKDYEFAKINSLKNENGFFENIKKNRNKTEFYFDKSSNNSKVSSSKMGNFKSRMTKRAPSGAITVSSEKEIKKYLERNQQCYSYPLF